MSDSQPNEWLELKLGDVVDYGKTEKIEPNLIDDDTWVLELEDIEKDNSKINNRLNFSDRKSKSTKNKFHKGDVLYGKLRPYLNKVVMADADGVCTTEIIPINGQGFVSNKFIFYWLKSSEFIKYATMISYGLNMPRLGTKEGLNAPFILPPKAEQERIAELLDSHLLQVENIKARLNAIIPILKKFRQSILADAVSGRLTESWRSDVQNWRNVKLSTISQDVTYGYTASSTQENTGTQLVRITDLQDNSIDWNTVPYCEIKETDLQKYKLRKNDLLFARTGATVGKSHLLKETPKNAVYASYLIRVRLKHGNDINYLAIYFQSPQYWNDISDLSAGIGQPNVNGTKLKNLQIPLPPIEEQTEIVERVEQLFTYADTIETQITNALQRVNQLTQSILHQAFTGQLTADWRAKHPELITGDNSAESLLAKIQAEKDKAKPVKKPRKKKEA